MPILPRVRGVLRALAGRGTVECDLDAEMAGCFETLVDEKMAAGMSESEARRQAQLEIGGVEQVKEAVRGAGPTALLESIARDARYGLRLLAKTPGFSATAILVLALGIGASTAVFSLIDILWLRPLPGSDQPGQAVGIYTRDLDRTDAYRSFSYEAYEAVRDQAKAFTSVTAHASTQVGVTEGALTRRSNAVFATGDYFATLGVGLTVGRTFTREEEQPGSGASVLILSHPFWQHLGSPRDVVGRTVVVNSKPFTVVGVAPAGFAGPMVLAGPQFWMPLGAASLFAPAASAGRAADPGDLGLMVVGRVKPGMALAAANASLAALSPGLPRARDGRPQRLSLAPLSRFNQSVRPSDNADESLTVPLAALAGAALIVLIIASLNVANMQLARGTSRRKEIAMRLALGAGSGRIVRQLMIEALILAAAAGALGLVASVWSLDAIVASFAPVVPDAIAVDVSPNWRIALACLALCALAALGFGLGPSWKLARVNLLPEMKSQDGAGAGAGLRRVGPRNLLVASQVALSLALLAASGLFVRGALAASVAEPGYSFDRQLLVKVDASAGGLEEAAGRAAYQRLVERIRSMPGVESVAVASHVAFANESTTRRVSRPGSARTRDAGPAGGTSALAFDIGTEYFKTLGLSMLRGREFSRAEEVDPSATGVAIIDEPLASAIFPGEDPIGQHLQLGRDVAEPPVQVVGVAPGLRHRLSDVGPVPHVYLPLGPHYRPVLNFHVRAALQAGHATAELRAALGDVVRTADSRVGILAVQTLGDARDSMPINWTVRTAARTFGGFGLVALFMAAIGLYGVKAYLVARRTREFGIRLALGATDTQVIGLVLREGSILLAVSIVAGCLLAVALGQVVSSLLVGVQAFDPLVLGAATFVLAAAVLLACYLPARLAVRVPPVTALRIE